MTIATREVLWEAWVEWKERCALHRCSCETGGLLSAFATHRLSKFVDRLRRDTRPHAVTPVRDAWHLFETHLLLKRSRKGIRYKEWLFARLAGSTDDPLDVIQGGATLILRDVARETWRTEGVRHGTVSLQAPLGEGGELGVTLEDLLAGTAEDPADAAAAREYERLATQHAAEVLSALTPRECIVMLARALGLSFAHSAVERLARCGKSQLSDCFRMLAVRTFDHIKRTYQGEDRQQLVRLSVMTLQQVAEQALAREKSERRFAALFSLSGEGVQTSI